jgi:hypothetical protein
MGAEAHAGRVQQAKHVRLPAYALPASRTVQGNARVHQMDVEASALNSNASAAVMALFAKTETAIHLAASWEMLVRYVIRDITVMVMVNV